MLLKVLIDASTVTSQVDGLSHYIINLIKYLPEESFDKFEFTVLINKGLERKALTQHLHDNPQIKVIESSIAPIGPKRDWNMFWFLKQYENEFDLIHITSNNYPFVLKNAICTVHDITFKQFFDNPKYSFNLAVTYMDRVIRNMLKKSIGVIAVSQATKSDLVKTYNLNNKISNKIKVIHEGWEHFITEMTANKTEVPEVLSTETDYILYVGSNRVHKNISGLLQSFKKAMPVIPANKKLIIIGSDKYLKPVDSEIINDINDKDKRVIFTGYLSQPNVEAYFKNADAYIFPSWSEGFGLGVLEAFYYKVPLLCSNTTSLPEIAGDAALYFDPFNNDDIANTIEKFYKDPSIAKDLVDKGIKRLESFSWKKTSLETITFYEECLDKKSSI